VKFRAFGRAGFRVSEIGMGCWAIGGSRFGNSYGATDDAESVRAIKKALELGCNFFDTADVYGHGHSEELLGLGLSTTRMQDHLECGKLLRERVFIATKCGGAYMYNDEKWGVVNFSEEYIKFALENSLRRLRTSYMDVCQLHNPPLYLIEEGEIFRPLRKLQEAGKIRCTGVSVHSLDEGLAALDHVDSIQCVFNMLDPRNYELMETAKRRGIAIIAREPLANGLATGKYAKESRFEKGDIRGSMPPEYMEAVLEEAEKIKKRFAGRQATLAQIALKYVLSFDSVSVTIPGAKTAAQIEENMKASDIPELTEEELAVFGS